MPASVPLAIRRSIGFSPGREDLEASAPGGSSKSAYSGSAADLSQHRRLS